MADHKILDLRPYMWYIAKVGAANDKDYTIALEMFVTNLKLGKAEYTGADELDYADLSVIWNGMTEDERARQRELVRLIVYIYFKELGKCVREDDHAGYDKLVKHEIPRVKLASARAYTTGKTWEECCEYFGIFPDANDPVDLKDL